jgi:hypothetical protein
MNFSFYTMRRRGLANLVQDAVKEISEKLLAIYATEYIS